MDKYQEVEDWKEWKLVPCDKNIPQQDDSYNCGVYVCMYALHIANNIPLPLITFDPKEYKKVIAACILNGKII